MKLVSILQLSAALLMVCPTVCHAQTSDEKAAIKRVITDSKTDFNKRDLNAFSAHFIKSPALYYQIRTADNQLYMAHGWEAMTHMVGNHMKNDPQDFPVNPTPISSTDTYIQVRGNIAWVDETGHWESAGKKWQGRDLIILEKQADNSSVPRWKIATLTSQVYADKQLVVVK